MMLLVCIKQHLSNIWSSTHEKLSNTEAGLKKSIAKFICVKFCYWSSWSRQSNTLERPVSEAPNSSHLSTTHWQHALPAVLRTTLPAQATLLLRQNIEKLDICENIIPSKTFNNLGSLLTSLLFTFKSFLHFYVKFSRPPTLSNMETTKTWKHCLT